MAACEASLAAYRAALPKRLQRWLPPGSHLPDDSASLKKVLRQGSFRSGKLTKPRQRLRLRRIPAVPLLGLPSCLRDCSWHSDWLRCCCSPHFSPPPPGRPTRPMWSERRNGCGCRPIDNIATIAGSTIGAWSRWTARWHRGGRKARRPARPSDWSAGSVRSSKRSAPRRALRVGLPRAAVRDLRAA